MTQNLDTFWHSEWDRVRACHIAWWKHEGLVLNVQTPCDDLSGEPLSTSGLDFTSNSNYENNQSGAG